MLEGSSYDSSEVDMVMKNGQLVGTVDVDKVTDDDLLGRIILGKHPGEQAEA